MSHTPAPWHCVDRTGAGLEIHAPVGECVEVRLPDGIGTKPIHVFGLRPEPPHILIGYERWVQFDPEGWDEMQHANGALIAAAPLLLAACQAARSFGSQGETDDGTSVDHLLREAIKAATTPVPSRRSPVEPSGIPGQLNSTEKPNN